LRKFSSPRLLCSEEINDASRIKMVRYVLHQLSFERHKKKQVACARKRKQVFTCQDALALFSFLSAASPTGGDGWTIETLVCNDVTELNHRIARVIGA